MSKRGSLLALFVLILLLVGCNKNVVTTQGSPPLEQVKFDLLTTEKTLPNNFEKIAYQDGYQTFLVRKTMDQAGLEQTWRLFGLQEEKPKVDFDKNIVFFIGVHESGSCPLEIKRVDLNPEHTSMTIPLTASATICTADATPRTFVIQLEKNLTENIKDLVINDATVPIE